jgi:hypothetical protein
MKLFLDIPNPFCIFAHMNNPKEHLIPSPEDKPHVFRGMSTVMDKLYPYRNLTIDEIKVGTKCQKRIVGEFDTEVCSPANCMHDYNLTDELGWYWVNHELTEYDLGFMATLIRGKAFGPNGFFRIKK